MATSSDRPTTNTHLLGWVDEMAKLLGFAHFADLTTHRRMAKRGDAAWAFITDLHARAQPFFLREVEALEAFDMFPRTPHLELLAVLRRRRDS